MAEQRPLPHNMTMNDRKKLQMTGVTEVISFDENTVLLKVGEDTLTIHGQQLQLKTLSLEGGQVAVEGTIHAFVYGQSQKGGIWRRLLG